MSERPGFRKELEAVINRYSKENGSDTPDFILADYLEGCLDVFDRVTQSRDYWYRKPPPDANEQKTSGMQAGRHDLSGQWIPDGNESS